MRGCVLDDLTWTCVEESWLWPARVRAICPITMAFPVHHNPNCLQPRHLSGDGPVCLAAELKAKRPMLSFGRLLKLSTADATAASRARTTVLYLVGWKLCA